ncbi:MAG: hypothetical protein Q7T44_02405 [Parvibaculum sp.]|nr:hypothetical protein [Parvibaculum sp.]
MANSRANSGLMTGVAVKALATRLSAAALLLVPLAAQAETLGTLTTSTSTPGKVITTTTGPDGKTTTTTATVPAPVTPSGSSGPRIISTSPAVPAAAAPASGTTPQALPGAGPQPITPPGIGGTSAPIVKPTTAFPTGDDTPRGAPLQALPVVPGQKSSGISMGELGGVDASAAGLIGSGDGGFSTNMWAGVSRTNVDQDLARMPVGTGSPVANDLARRLLLTTATPPQGQTSGLSLLAIRLDRLSASGRADLAAELGKGTMADTSPPVAVARARASLALGDDKTACSELNNLPAGNDPAHDELDAFSTRLSAFCQISSGNNAAANVTLDLAREEGYDDPLFYSLAAEANDGLKLKAAAPKSLDALDVRFYALAKRALPENAGSIADTSVVKLLAQNENLSSPIRIEAAERAVEAGVLKGVDLSAIYNETSFKPDEVDAARAGIYPKTAALRRAVLFQAIAVEILPTDRAGLMAAFLNMGIDDKVYLASVESLLPTLTATSPLPELKFFAPAATRALLMAGKRDEATKWFALVGNDGSRDARELSSLMRLSDPAGLKPIDTALAAAIAADLKSGVAATQNFAATEAMIYDASGQVLPQNVLEALVAAPRSVGAPELLLNQLRSAGLKGSLGEVVLLSLVAIGPGGPESADRQAVAQSVSSLRAVHLESEARRLALEALLGRSHAGHG